MRLSPTQKDALRKARPDRWSGASTNGVQGNTQIALHDRGLADLRIVNRRGRVLVEAPAGTRLDTYVGSNTLQYRLTSAGEQKRQELA